MKRVIVAAESDPNADRLKEVLDALDDDYDYFHAGIEKLSRSGVTSIDDAVSIVHQLSSAVQEGLSMIAELVGGDPNEE